MPSKRVGEVPVYFDSDTGELFVHDTDVMAAARDSDEEDVEVGFDDDYGDDDDDEAGDDDDEAGDDDDDYGDEDEAAGRRGRGRRQGRRAKHRAKREVRREARQAGTRRDPYSMPYSRAALEEITGTTVDFYISVDTDFRIEDMSFQGSTAGAKISQVWAGSQPIFNPGAAVDVNNFAPTSLMRQKIQGLVKAGSRIRIVGTVATTGDTFAVLAIGHGKPQGCPQ